MDSQMTYKWTIPIYPVNPQAAGATLETIITKHGSLKPSFVVDESRDKNATLHKCFEWDDESAAEKYRERQAQDLIRNLVAVKIGRVETAKPIRAFISFKHENEYVSVVNVINSSSFRESLLETAMKELEAFQRKYAALEYLTELMSSIDESIRKYQQYADI